MNDLGLFERKGSILVSSRIIAEKFEKKHKEIIYILEGRTSIGAQGNVEIKNNSLINDLLQGGISPILNHKTLMLTALMEDIISNTIAQEMEKGVYYKTIYKICKDKIRRFVSLSYLKAF